MPQLRKSGYVRGETRPRKSDGIYRAALRGESTHMRERAEAAAAELLKGNAKVKPGKAELLETRKLVENGWGAIARLLAGSGQRELSEKVHRFVAQMPPARTERGWILHGLRDQLAAIRGNDLQRAR